MTAIRIRADVTQDRRLVLELPADFPTGPVEVDVQVASRRVPVVDLPLPRVDPSKFPHTTDAVTGERHLVERSGLVREIGEPRT